MAHKCSAFVCGELFPVPNYGIIPNYGAKPIVVTKLSEEDEMPTKPKPRQCRNCGRVKVILGDDLCSGCYCSVRGYEKGTAAYDERLAAAKKRFSDPNYKSTRGGDRRSKKLSPEKIKKIVMPFFPNKDQDKITAEDILIAERNGLQDRIFKINQALEILS
jgi:hypothetical protein